MCSCTTCTCTCTYIYMMHATAGSDFSPQQAGLIVNEITSMTSEPEISLSLANLAVSKVLEEQETYPYPNRL